jgi:hypothetical protein
MSSATEQALVQQILGTLDRINAKTTDLQNGINSKMWLLPGPLQDKVKSGWDKFCRFMSDLWDDIVEFVTNMGRPWTLTAVGDQWTQRVGGPVSNEVNSVDAGYLTVDTNWDGDAADAYRDTLPLQKDALAQINDSYATAISGALSDVATGIIAFWGSLFAALVALVGGICGAIGSAATVFGLPAAPFIAAGAAVVCAGSVLAGGLYLKYTASTANSQLLQKISDGSKLYRGHWPPAVAQ